MTKKALIVLSGGQDSTTCLYQAKEEFDEIHAITFNYGQRHVREIEAAKKIAELAGVASHEVLDLSGNILKSTSPLVSDNELEQYKDHQSLPGGLEKTFVPARNLLFLTLAANRAFALGTGVIITGVCEEDFGGYPDCRQVFIDAMLETIKQAFPTELADGTPWNPEIRTPLMSLDKKQSVELATQLPGCVEALAYSQTSYDGAYPPTGNDHATLLRAKGFEFAGIPDPLVARAIFEGVMDTPESSNYDIIRNGTVKSLDDLVTNLEALEAA